MNGLNATNGTNGKDALELLQSDHQRVRDLFTEIQGTPARQRQRVLFENIRNELEAHASIEESLFYPRIAQADPGLTGKVAESVGEHQKVRLLLQECTRCMLEGDTVGFDTAIRQLSADVEHHASEEESEIFPRVREALDPSELSSLGGALQAAKDERMGYGSDTPDSGDTGKETEAA